LLVLARLVVRGLQYGEIIWQDEVLVTGDVILEEDVKRTNFCRRSESIFPPGASREATFD
jgi:hypothetical protein